MELIEHLRRMKKWSARRIARELTDGNHAHCTVRTVTRWLDRLGLDRIRDVTADGEYLRRPGKVSARYPGHMVHMDVKKVGKIPDGGGWWAQGRGSEKALAGKRAHKQKVGYTYLHSIEDEFSRLAYTEALEDETAATTIAFFHRARVFFAAHGITRISRLVTDNGSNYTARAFRRSTCAFIGRHQRTRIYTPRHNGKIERYQRLMTDECLYARAYDSEAERRAPRRDRGLEPPLQLPSAPHRLRRSTSGLTPPRQRRQRHDQLHLDLAHGAVTRLWTEILGHVPILLAETRNETQGTSLIPDRDCRTDR